MIFVREDISSKILSMLFEMIKRVFLLKSIVGKHMVTAWDIPSPKSIR